MADRTESESRKLLGRLSAAMAEPAAGQARLDRIVQLIAELDGRPRSARSTCSATPRRWSSAPPRGSSPRRSTRPGCGSARGWSGRTARDRPVDQLAPTPPPSAASATCPRPARSGSRRFCGVPIQRLGDALGVLVVQSRAARELHPRRGLRARGRGDGAGRDDRARRLHRRRRAALARRPATSARSPSAACRARRGRRRAGSSCTSRGCVVTNPISDDPDARAASASPPPSTRCASRST